MYTLTKNENQSFKEKVNQFEPVKSNLILRHRYIGSKFQRDVSAHSDLLRWMIQPTLLKSRGAVSDDSTHICLYGKPHTHRALKMWLFVFF